MAMNKALLFAELMQLTPHERLELAYGLLESVLHDARAPALSDAQRRPALGARPTNTNRSLQGTTSPLPQDATHLFPRVSSGVACFAFATFWAP
jgi:hypothetical protein